MSIDTQVLLDSARQLKSAARIIEKLAKVTACTEEHERKQIIAAIANIHAALARIQP